MAGMIVDPETLNAIKYQTREKQYIKIEIKKFQRKPKLRGHVLSSVLELLFSMHEALGLIPTIAKKKENREKKEAFQYQSYTFIPTFIAAVLTLAKLWNWPRYLSTYE